MTLGKNPQFVRERLTCIAWINFRNYFLDCSFVTHAMVLHRRFKFNSGDKPVKQNYENGYVMYRVSNIKAVQV